MGVCKAFLLLTWPCIDWKDVLLYAWRCRGFGFGRHHHHQPNSFPLQSESLSATDLHLPLLQWLEFWNSSQCTPVLRQLIPSYAYRRSKCPRRLHGWTVRWSPLARSPLSSRGCLTFGVHGVGNVGLPMHARWTYFQCGESVLALFFASSRASDRRWAENVIQSSTLAQGARFLQRGVPSITAWNFSRYPFSYSNRSPIICSTHFKVFSARLFVFSLITSLLISVSFLRGLTYDTQ